VAEPFLSEIRLMSFNFPPKGWALCNGQSLPINQNQALFSLLGTTYGGNGQTTFNLPNLQGRMPIHTGNGHTLGEAAGSNAVTINVQQMTQHLHQVTGAGVAGAVTNPTATSVLANSAGQQLWGPPNNLLPMDPGSVTSVGGSQPHTNLQPYGVISMCIALQGIFPSQN
jgi:microcystin-dependent protein